MTTSYTSTSGDEAKPVQGLSKDQKLQRFKEWLKLSTESEAAQREREKEDLQFQVGENQWTEKSKEERWGRPMLSISLLHQPLQLVANQAANAHLGVELSPVNETADDELAEIKQGLYQRIQRDGMADQARLWALDRATKCGRGWYRIITKYDEDSDNPSDQEIAYERILYQENVFPDPTSQKPDFSDGRFIFHVGFVSCSEFHRRYPGAEKYGADDWDGMIRSDPEWVQNDGKANNPLVAEVFYKEYDTTPVTVPGSDYSRSSERCVVWRAVITGCEIVEDESWLAGGVDYFPIIPVVGRELQPVDGKRRWEGMIRPARDGQRLFNVAASTMVEDVLKLSKAPIVGVEGQFAGHEKEWTEANRRVKPYLEYRSVDLDGKPAPPPGPMQIDGTKMQLSVALMQEGKSMVQVATAVYEPSLGEMQAGAKGQSGKAIQALQQQADAGTGNYLGNLASISLPCEARLILKMMPIVYDRAGRVTQVLGGEDESKTVMLNQAFVPDPKTGKPVPIQVPPGQPMPEGAKIHDLSKGKYSITWTVGRAFQTRLQEGAEEMSQILSALPPEMQLALLPTWMKFRDAPGSKEAADILLKLRNKQFPFLAEQEGAAPNIEQVQAENEALKGQMQELTQQLQAASQAIETDQAKQQATIQKATLDAQTKSADAQLQAMVKQEMAKFQAAHEVALENDRQAAEAAITAQKLDFERWKVQFEAAHEVAMAAAGGNTAKVTRDRGQSNDQENEQEQGQGFSSSQESSSETAPDAGDQQ